MKHLKLKKLSSAMLFIAILSMVAMTSCKDDAPVVVPTDYAALNAKIVEAENLIATTEEGTAEGQYPRGSKDLLQDAIDGSKLIAADETATQAEVDNTVIGLQEKMDEYTAGAIVPIDPDNLAGHWTFTEGSGTTVADYSGNGFDGTFQTGLATFGSGNPAWTTDRYGNANGAIEFTDGGWIEVPYNAALNPSEITVSVWVKANVLGGRFMGLHSWLGYKFEVPDHGKPFFTANTIDGIWDNDAGISIVADEWIHLAVTYGGGNMTFYIDGDLAVAIPRTSNMVPVAAGNNLAIGVETSKFADSDANYGDELHPDYQIIPAAWASIYNGSLDELRIYKAALSATQIKSIYDVEKP